MSSVIDFPRWQDDSGREQQNNDYYDADETNEDPGDYDDTAADYSNEYDDGSDNADQQGQAAEEVHDRRYYVRQILRMVIVCAAAAGIILLILLQSRTRVYQSASYRKTTDLVVREGTTYAALGSNIVAWSRDGASCMTTGGSQVWNITYEMQEPVASINGSVIAVGDYNGSEIHIMNDTKVLGTVDTNMPIRGLAVSSSGEVAAVLNDSDTTWIYLFKSDGTTIAYFKTTMGKSGYPLSVAVSPGGKIVGVSHLTVGSQAVNTSIAFYNFGSVGQNKTDNQVDGYNYSDEVFPYLFYMNSATCAAVSDKRLVFFNGDEIPRSGANALFNAQVQGVFANKDYIVIIFPDMTGQEQYSMQVYNAEGNLVSTIGFTLDYSNIQLCSNRIVINDDQTLLIYNTDGTLRYSGNFDSPVRAVIPSESSTNRLTVITESAMEQMVLE